MATRDDIQHAGMAPLLAALIGQHKATGLTATGTTQGTAYALGDVSVAQFSTVNSNTGAILSGAASSPWVMIINSGSNPILVYPAVGESINNSSANASFPVTNGKTGLFVPAEGQWVGLLSA